MGVRYGYIDDQGVEITNETLPAYLRGAGHPDLADIIETAELNPEAQAEALEAIQAELDEGAEEHDVITRMRNALRAALDGKPGDQ